VEEQRQRVLEERVLRGMYKPTRVKMAGSWGNFQRDAFHNSISSPNIFRIIKSRNVM
jgi:hypothetical protein